ncbi:hypothetical protein B0H15DRAFT_303966 [Mycena belliarum]|uniref:MARVEL domain-containing protein n=1 Tax=Mycena belliarum TaxID=1033014 RepID=A0AAD6U2W6_9AGAR|nr:hypothetical protein B0H15DRAFT_303966 [Mycena belliae]
MALIPLIRLIALSVVLGFAVIVLGLSAALTSTTETFLGGYFEFAALAIATACLTLITLPIMIALEFLRSGSAFTSMIVVELSWLSILWVLWLATAAEGAQAGQFTFVSGCGYIDSTVEGACRQTAAIQAFSFLNWLILLAYTTLILVLTIIAASRKHAGVWKSSVGNAPFFTQGKGPAAQPTSAPAGSTADGGYTTQPYTAQPVTQHTTGGTMGGTGPASVQAGTVHV